MRLLLETLKVSNLTRTPGTDNFTIHGKPEVNIVTPTTYTMTITTIGNQEGCQEET